MDTPPPPRRPLVVVDTETNGLDPSVHQVVEAAWWNLGTGDRGCVVPHHDVNAVLGAASLRALQVNNYVDKIADRVPPRALDQTGTLYAALSGAMLIGSNVQFDAAMLRRLFADHAERTPWHYRLWEIGPYAAGVLGLDHIPGLAELAELLGVTPGDHSAAGDVTTTGECFLELRTRATARKVVA